MNTAAQFIVPPHSPLQRTIRTRRSGLALPVAVVLGAHLLLFSTLLIRGWMRETGVAGVSPEQMLPSLASSVPKEPPHQAVVGAGAATAAAVPGVVQDSTVPPPAVSAPGLTPSSTTEPVLYEIRAGDTLTKIARLHGTTIGAIRLVNDLRSDKLALGQKIRVPEARRDQQP